MNELDIRIEQITATVQRLAKQQAEYLDQRAAAEREARRCGKAIDEANKHLLKAYREKAERTTVAPIPPRPRPAAPAPTMQTHSAPVPAPVAPIANGTATKKPRVRKAKVTPAVDPTGVIPASVTVPLADTSESWEKSEYGGSD